MDSIKVLRELVHQIYFFLVALQGEHWYKWAALMAFGLGVISYIVHHYFWLRERYRK